MSSVEFKLDKKNFRTEVLQSKEMLKITEEYAQQEAGSDTHLKPFIGFDRAHTIVYPNTRRHPS